MNVEQLAIIVIDACEAEGIGHMLTGAFAASFYGVPRSTSDVDLVVDLEKPEFFAAIATRLSEYVAFDPQIQFDTLTWGRRHVGATTTDPPFLVEVFELFDDPLFRTVQPTATGCLADPWPNHLAADPRRSDHPEASLGAPQGS